MKSYADDVLGESSQNHVALMSISYDVKLKKKDVPGISHSFQPCPMPISTGIRSMLVAEQFAVVLSAMLVTPSLISPSVPPVEWFTIVNTGSKSSHRGYVSDVSKQPPGPEGRRRLQTMRRAPLRKGASLT